MAWRKRKVDPMGQYRAALVQALQASDAVDRVEVLDDRTLGISAPGFGEAGRLNLAGTLTEWESADEQGRGELVQRMVQRVIDAGGRPTSWDEARDLVVPAVRSWSYVHSDPLGSSMVRWPLVPHLSLLTVLAGDGWMSPVMTSDLEEWDVDADAVRAAALDHLRSTGIGLAHSDLPGVVEVVGPESHVSAALDPSVLDTVASVAREQVPSLGEEVVVLAPVRDRAFLVGTSDLGLLAQAIEEAGAVYEGGDRPLSPAPYVLAGECLVPWRVPADHPLHLDVERAHHLLAQVEYDEQGDRLRNLFDRAGEEVYVANLLTAMSAERGVVRSYAVWGPAPEPALLPTADEIAFGSGDEGFAVHWDDAVRLAGPWLVDQGLEPARWRIEGHPPDEVVEQLRAVGHPFGE